MDSGPSEHDIFEKKILDPNAAPLRLPLKFLEDITDRFSNERKLGSGGFGVVYKGVLRSGEIIAVKKLFDRHLVENSNQFENELTYLIGVKHQNVVQLKGYCVESRSEAIQQQGRYILAEIRTGLLCFEYLCNKSLDNYISNESRGLDWDLRYQIIMGICSGLHFLHEKCRIIHLDLKPQNILMDGNMMPKIADFGLSRILGANKSQTIVTGQLAGTLGYMAPEYLNNGIVSTEADIFSFGVLVIEIITGCRDHPLNFLLYLHHVSKSNLPQITDTSFPQFTENVLKSWSNRIENAADTQQITECIAIALKCLNPELKRRPNARDIIQMLSAVENSKLHPRMGHHKELVNASVMKELTPDSMPVSFEDGSSDCTRLKGFVVLMKKSILGNKDFSSSIISDVNVLLGRRVTFQLVSSTAVDPYNGNRGKVGLQEPMEEYLTILPSLNAGESSFNVGFRWEVEKLGVPGAIIVRNNLHTEFFLKSVTLNDVPGRGTIVFMANSWVYPDFKYKCSRVFFTSDTYLPSQMPAALKPYRDEEFRILRGDDQPGPYMEHDRVYRYDVYNDLGHPDRGNPRPTLGGSKDHPYPRRGRTGRKPTHTDPNSEYRLPLLKLDVYVPRDERLGHLKSSDYLNYSIKGTVEALMPATLALTDSNFDSFEDILKVYIDGLKLRGIPSTLKDEAMPLSLLRFPVPGIIKEDLSVWMTDEEFAREIVAGTNPTIIRRLTEFPPKSILDRSKYGDQTSTITAADLEKNLEGLTVQQALKHDRLYILDHHDNFIPYLADINNLEGTFIYATRTLLYQRRDDTLAPLAIELSLPEVEDGVTTVTSTVYTPPSTAGGPEAWVWQLAKAYVNVNDYCWHQMVSHWLNTHAVMEPFVIATSRHLSVTHPVHKLLRPHYRNTMSTNALARQCLINGGGMLEMTVCARQYALRISSASYKNWNFVEQALPNDLIKRGMAVPDPSSPYKVQMLLKDYPYATDGLEIWHAIEQWVEEYLALYYPDDGVLRADTELQAWWKEVREVGHGDLKDEPWWPEMQTLEELRKACATIIWIASALHAAVNFGQYAYAGYPPNRPSTSRRPMPMPDTPEYAEMECNPEKAFLHTITNCLQAIVAISLLEILSKHASDEVYLGQRDDELEWTSDARAQDAFRRFSRRMTEIESRVVERNRDSWYKNRCGPAMIPYTMLFPGTSDRSGDNSCISAKGIPNSISI